MRCFRFVSSALTLVAALTFTPPVAGLSILWDDSHDLDDDELTTNYSVFASLVPAPHTLTELDGSPGALTAAALIGHDVLMVFDAEEPFTSDEISAVQAFVAGGGMLFIAGDSPGAFDVASHNVLLAPYGIQFDPDNTVFGEFFVTHFESDPLTTDLFSLSFSSSGILLVSGTGKVLGNVAFGQEVVFASGQSGQVVVLADSSTLTDSFGPDTQLVTNLLAHFDALANPDDPSGPFEITIDIVPFIQPNPVFTKTKLPIPVALLTQSTADGDDLDFDPWDDVDMTTLRLGPDEAPLAHPQGLAIDVDWDGDLDMAVVFWTHKTGVACGDEELTLTGQTYDGGEFSGTDSIQTMDCRRRR